MVETVRESVRLSASARRCRRISATPQDNWQGYNQDPHRVQSLNRWRHVLRSHRTRVQLRLLCTDDHQRLRVLTDPDTIAFCPTMGSSLWLVDDHGYVFGHESPSFRIHHRRSLHCDRRLRNTHLDPRQHRGPICSSVPGGDGLLQHNAIHGLLVQHEHRRPREEIRLLGVASLVRQHWRHHRGFRFLPVRCARLPHRL